MTAAVASPSTVPLLSDGGEREPLRRGGKKLSSIFSSRNAFVLRKKLRSSSLSATATSAAATSSRSYQPSTSSRSSSTNLSQSCRADCDHCSTSNSRLSTSPLSPHSAWSDDSDEEAADSDELQSAATMSDEEERRDVVSPPSSSCSFSSSSSSGSSHSSSSSSSSNSSASLSPLPTHISPRGDARARRRMHHKESPVAEQKEAYVSLPPPSPIVALPPLHPHALTHTHTSIPLAHLHALAASSPSVVGTPPSSYRQSQQPKQSSSAATSHTPIPPPSATAASPVKGNKHHRSHSASNQVILLQGGATGLSPSARSPSTSHTVNVSPVQTSPFPSPLPSPHIPPVLYSPQQHHHSQQHQHQHQHHYQRHHQHHHNQHHSPHHQFRHPPPSPLVFSSSISRSTSQYTSPVSYTTLPFHFMSQQPFSSPPSPTPTTAMQPPTSPTVPIGLQYMDGQAAGQYLSSPAPAASRSAASPPPLASAVFHPSTYARPMLTRASSTLAASSLLHPHPRRSSMLDLAALENGYAQSSKPRSVSSAATFPSFESNSGGHVVEHIAHPYPSPAEVQRLLATPLAALLGLSESEPSRSHVPKAVARCLQARSSPDVTATGTLLSSISPSSFVEIPTEAMPSSSVAVLSPLCLHRELRASVPSSPASYANVAASLPRRLSIGSAASSASSGYSSSGSSNERERRLSSASLSSSLPPSPLVKSTPSPSVVLRGIPWSSRLLPTAQSAAASDAPVTLTSTTPLLTPSSRQTSQSKPAGGAEEVVADNGRQTRKQIQKKQRIREVKQPTTPIPSEFTEQPSIAADGVKTVAVSRAASGLTESDCTMQAPTAPIEGVIVADADAESRVMQSLDAPAAHDTVVEHVRKDTAVSTTATSTPPVVSVVPMEALTSAAVESNRTQLDKKPRPARANRRRASSAAGQPPAATDTLATTTSTSAPAPSIVWHSWSIRFSVMALHSSLLSTISSLINSSSTAATHHWSTVCTFYHSFFASSASRRRFVSRLRTLSHSTQQLEQSTQQPVKARHSQSLRYRHHPLLERQKQTKECPSTPAMALLDADGSSGGELLMPRWLVLCMVLCCMFLGTVVVTFWMLSNREPLAVEAGPMTVDNV